MGTPISPEPDPGGADCVVCSGIDQCFAGGTPSQIRVTYAGISGCHPHNDPPDGPYILAQTGPAVPCEFELENLPEMKHNILFNDTAGRHIAYHSVLGVSYYYYMAFQLKCALVTVNQIDDCQPGAHPPEIGVGGSAVIEINYIPDLQFYAYGSGFFPKDDMKYDTGDCADGDKWYKFCSVKNRINCLIRGKIAQT